MRTHTLFHRCYFIRWLIKCIKLYGYENSYPFPPLLGESLPYLVRPYSVEVSMNWWISISCGITRINNRSLSCQENITNHLVNRARAKKVCMIYGLLSMHLSFINRRWRSEKTDIWGKRHGLSAPWQLWISICLPFFFMINTSCTNATKKKMHSCSSN